LGRGIGVCGKKFTTLNNRQNSCAGSSSLFASTDVDQLKLQEKAEVRKICEERLQSYIAKRGLGVWDYRMLEDGMRASADTQASLPTR
jgi:hypothetical protein